MRSIVLITSRDQMNHSSNFIKLIILATGWSIFACSDASTGLNKEEKKKTESTEENISRELTPEEKAKKLVDYNQLKEKIKTEQAAFQKKIKKAGTKGEEKLIIDAARKYILTNIGGSIFQYWYGTSWAFEGTTTEPGCGSVACGYFVTTVLRDAGFKLPRIKWAQAASETLIQNVTDKKNIKHYIGTDIVKVESAIKLWGEGLYIAGLDTHVGFILNLGDSIRFVHSNYYEPTKGVCAQQLNSNNPLKDSKYRVIGKILNDEMVLRWIEGKELGLTED